MLNFENRTVSGRNGGIRRKFLSLAAVLLIVLSAVVPLTAVQAAAVTETAEAEETVFEFAEKKVTMAVGHRMDLTLNASPVYKKIIYKSSKPDIISVDSKGKLTALQRGVATITAKVNNQIYTRCTVEAIVPVESVTLTQAVITLSPGQTYRLRAKVLPEDATYKKFEWFSQSPSVATIESGTVTAVSKGMTMVYAKTKEGVCGYCVVQVKTMPEKVTLEEDNPLTLTQGETHQLKASIWPVNADNKSLTWKTSNSSIVSVDTNGKITAVGTGRATIKAVTVNKKTALLTVQVYPKIASITLSEKEAVLGCGERMALKAIIQPANVLDNTVTWTSSRPEVATIGQGLVYSKAVGTTVITATAADGQKASCTITVKNSPSYVKLEPSEVAIGVGESYKLKTTLPAESASRAIGYFSDDPDICDVAQDGTIIGKGVGVTTITVRIFSGRSASVKVWVKAAPTAITLDDYQLSMNVGDVKRLNTHIDGQHASRQRRFVSSNSAVASVDASGNITAKGTGTAVITVYTYNNVKAQCVVTVKNLQETVDFKTSVVSLLVGETEQLEAVVTNPSAGTSLTYRSDDTAVCTVDSKGLVKGVGAGSTTVRVTTASGKTAVCTVKVAKKTTAVYCYVKKKAMCPGQSFQLQYYFKSDETPVSVTYTSTNSAVATVSTGGQVKAVSVGKAYITVTAYGGAKAVCEITVTNDTAVLRQDLSNNVPLNTHFTAISQNPELPTGCEITALTMVLNYYGYPVKKEVMADKYLDKGYAWLTDFRVAFAGDPFDEYSYGCYAPVIVKAANKYLVEQNSSLRATELKEMDFDDLFNFTKQGIPVLVWTTLDLLPGYYTSSWVADNGETVTWYTNEHCMVLLGDGGSTVYVADPTRGNIAAYDKDLFRTRYQELFSQAVVIQ